MFSFYGGKTCISNFLLWTFFLHDKKVNSFPVLGWLSYLLFAWPNWTTIAVVFFLTGLHNGFWIIKNFLLLRLSAFSQSMDLCWIVLCLGLFSFGPLPGWAWMLPLAFAFFFFSNLIFALELESHLEVLQAGEEWVSMATGMLLGAQGFHGRVPTNYNSKAPVGNFKTVSPFTDCLLNAPPVFSSCFTPYK